MLQDHTRGSGLAGCEGQPKSHLRPDLELPYSIHPNKCDWNAAAIPGGVDNYPDGDWPTRIAIVKRHREFALGLLYFLQNDSAVPQKVRTEARRWALPRDEFTDNGHFPHEFYLREARRIVGRYMMRESDARPDDALTEPVAGNWARIFGELLDDSIEAGAWAREVAVLERREASIITTSGFRNLLQREREYRGRSEPDLIELEGSLGIDESAPLSRAKAC